MAWLPPQPLPPPLRSVCCLLSHTYVHNLRCLSTHPLPPPLNGLASPPPGGGAGGGPTHPFLRQRRPRRPRRMPPYKRRPNRPPESVGSGGTCRQHLLSSPLGKSCSSFYPPLFYRTSTELSSFLFYRTSTELSSFLFYRTSTELCSFPLYRTSTLKWDEKVF